MAARDLNEGDLLRVPEPLAPYLDRIVLCGAWTLFVYRKWVLKEEGPLPLRTGDVDFAVRRRLPVIERPLDDLLTGAGFHGELYGGSGPGTVHYEKKDGAIIEFLTWLEGSGPGRTHKVQKGLQASEIRYLEILFETPVEVPVPGTSMKVRVPTLGAYVFQKGLSFLTRTDRSKRGKDLAYIFDAVSNFPRERPGLVAELERLRKKYPAPWFKRFLKNVGGFFKSSADEGPRMLEEQKPHPYHAMLEADPTNLGPRFRELVYQEVSGFLKELE